MWALGDYHRIAKEFYWGYGPELVGACAIGPGQRVLDVAAGTGNVALRAAEAGAEVVAVDITPEQFEAGRREAAERGVEVEWVEGDAAALPFGDDEFDVVTSSAGAIFAPDHQQVADELVRVCRPAGAIGMINFTPGSMVDHFFAAFARYGPPPDGELSPILWGSEQHVRELFGDRVDPLALTRKSYLERSRGGPREFCEFYKETFGPIVGLYASVPPETAEAIDRDFLDFAIRWGREGADGRTEYEVEYLLVVARVV
jgi:ubiquinone/menaquinone biosynthesis C-methylase UbiE